MFFWIHIIHHGMFWKSCQFMPLAKPNEEVTCLAFIDFRFWKNNNSVLKVKGVFLFLLIIFILVHTIILLHCWLPSGSKVIPITNTYPKETCLLLFYEFHLLLCFKDATNLSHYYVNDISSKTSNNILWDFKCHNYETVKDLRK